MHIALEYWTEMCQVSVVWNVWAHCIFSFEILGQKEGLRQCLFPVWSPSIWSYLADTAWLSSPRREAGQIKGRFQWAAGSLVWALSWVWADSNQRLHRSIYPLGRFLHEKRSYKNFGRKGFFKKASFNFLSSDINWVFEDIMCPCTSQTKSI